MLHFMIIFSIQNKQDGFLRLYRGLATPMITVAFYNAITFSVYEAALKRIKEHKQLGGKKDGAGIHQNVLAGLASGLARVRYL